MAVRVEGRLTDPNQFENIIHQVERQSASAGSCGAGATAPALCC
jgi:hypothetical protein